jgi:hypothetical protein
MDSIFKGKNKLEILELIIRNMDTTVESVVKTLHYYGFHKDANEYVRLLKLR